jgi:uroporphyrinogen-III synthase
MTLRALITRPEDDAAPLAAALNQRGIDTAIEPLLSIRTLEDAGIDLKGVQALLFTSANGVRSFAELASARGLGNWRGIDVLAVGDATARAARAAGFAAVESAAGSVESLAKLAADKLDPRNGALFHAAGSAVAGDLSGLLGARGFEVRRSMIYEARPAESLSPATTAALETGAYDLVLFFSPRTAATFVGLAQAAGDKAVAGCRNAAALCLSPAVAEAVAPLPFRSVESAGHPDLPSMLQLVESVAGVSADAAAAEKIIDVTPAQAPPSPPRTAAPSPPPARTPWLATVAAAALAGAVAAGAVSLFLRPSAPVLPGDVSAAVETRLAAAEGTAADLAARLTAAEEATAGTNAALAELAADLVALRTDITSMATGTGDDGVALSQVTGRLAALEQRLETLASPTAGGVEGDTAVRLSAENIQLKQELATLRETLARTAEDNAGLTERLGAVERTLGDNAAASRQAALALAAANLNAALAGSDPFAAQLAALRDIAGRDPALARGVEAATAPVTSFGAAGIPTPTDLAAAFPAVADAIARAATKATPSDMAAEDGFFDGVWRKVTDGLSEAVTVRPEGEAEGDGPLERLARAERRLAAGNLAEAVAELDGLSGAAREAAAAWLDKARARLAADAAIDALAALALGRMAAPAGENAGG